MAKITQTDSSTIDVFELCINGQEIADARTVFNFLDDNQTVSMINSESM